MSIFIDPLEENSDILDEYENEFEHEADLETFRVRSDISIYDTFEVLLQEIGTSLVSLRRARVELERQLVYGGTSDISRHMKTSSKLITDTLIMLLKMFGTPGSPTQTLNAISNANKPTDKVEAISKLSPKSREKVRKAILAVLNEATPKATNKKVSKRT